jgi:hypothetical protein
MNLEGVEERLSKTNPVKKIKLGLYRITDVNKAKEEFNSSYEKCFNKDVELQVDQVWFICTSNFSGVIKSYFQIKKDDIEKIIYICDVCTDKEERRKGYFSAIFEYGLEVINEYFPTYKILLDVLAIDNTSSIQQREYEEEDLPDYEEEEKYAFSYGRNRQEDFEAFEEEFENAFEDREDYEYLEQQYQRQEEERIRQQYKRQEEERRRQQYQRQEEERYQRQEEERRRQDEYEQEKELKREKKKRRKEKREQEELEEREKELKRERRKKKEEKRIKREEKKRRKEELDKQEEKEREAIEREAIEREEKIKNTQFNPELEGIIEVYSKFLFKIKGIKYENNRFFIVMMYIKGNIELDVSTIVNKNLDTLKIYKTKNECTERTIGGNNFMTFQAVNKRNNRTFRDSLNTIFRHSPNPSILTFLLDNCSNMNLYIPEKDIEKNLINYNIYFLWYFQQPQTRTYFVSIHNQKVSDNLLSEHILWLISPYTNDYYKILPDIIPEFYSVVLPLVLDTNYISGMLQLVRGMRYLETETYRDICGDINVKFKSIIFTNEIKQLPLFGDDENAIMNSRAVYIQKLNGSETYYLNKAEIKLLKELLEESVEYGGAYGSTEFIENGKMASNLYTEKLLKTGNRNDISVPDGEVNYHVHPNYCFITEKMIVAWPSGADMRSATNISSYFSAHTKTHMCVTTTGIFFIKLNPEFYKFLQTLTTNCKKLLFSLVFIYFSNIEDLRHIRNSELFSVSKDTIEQFYRFVETAENVCASEIFTANMNIFGGIIDNYLNHINTVKLSTLLDFEKYNMTGLSRDTLKITQKLIQEALYELTTNVSCETSIEAEKSKEYNLYNITFAPWDKLLEHPYFKI